ncbi:unnamed protein product, partial [Mesorhabditis belari]|uniref:Gustatory receptor n=1 Tax=Mesorhabditis belari TaxID=2138241 RepID=A0AAF3EF58_9BILA
MPTLRLPAFFHPAQSKEDQTKLATVCEKELSIETSPYGGFGCTGEHDSRMKWSVFFKSQPIYAQYFKLLVLFVFALAHVFYITDFLEIFRIYEETEVNVDSRYPGTANQDANGVRFVMHLLVEYKKNLWMSVAAMCASLSASCFFLLLINEDTCYRFYLVLMRILDIVSFLSLPLLLIFRIMTVAQLNRHLNRVLVGLSRLSDPSVLMNRLKCSIEERENLVLCSLVIERSIFPVIVLEYLLVLAIITAAYIGLAYLIVYCIKHWFPHQRKPYRSVSQRLYGPLVQA